MNDMPEKRKHPRFNVKEGLIATLQPGGRWSGEIKNISKTGLQLMCLSSGDWFSEPTAVDIHSEDGKYHLEKIPCGFINDSPGENDDSANIVKWRLFGVQFEGMVPQQEETLNDLIKDYATMPDTL